jgi:hypothetical protein
LLIRNLQRNTTTARTGVGGTTISGRTTTEGITTTDVRRPGTTITGTTAGAGGIPTRTIITTEAGTVVVMTEVAGEVVTTGEEAVENPEDRGWGRNSV